MNIIEETRKQPNPTRISIRIPEKYHQKPIISHIAAYYGLEVNIMAATLGANAQGDGWFDLQLNGSPKQINSALIYLAELDVEILYQSGNEPDGW